MNAILLSDTQTKPLCLTGLLRASGGPSYSASPHIVSATPTLWERLVKHQPPPQLLSEVATASATAAPQKAVHQTSSSSRGRAPASSGAAALAVADIEARVAAAVRAVVGSDVDREAALMESGLDSLGSVELRNSLSRDFSLELPATLTFDYPCIAALATYLSQELRALAGDEVSTIETGSGEATSERHRGTVALAAGPRAWAGSNSQPPEVGALGGLVLPTI